jgi:predicted short-subunit dehydrogenase-like oxidoreductase (DUF2520 family)
MIITLIGSGHVATVLGTQAAAAGHQVKQVYSRTLEHAEKLATILNADATSDWAAIDQEVQLFIIAITDDALVEVTHHWHSTKAMVVHTAGSVSKGILQAVGKNFGVLYPLQSLRAEKRDYANLPLIVDANTPDDLVWLMEFAETLSDRVYMADDDKRRKIHLSAVLANNFTNHILAIAEAYCKAENIDFQILTPLIEETFEGLKTHSAMTVQTGPAVRGDQKTMALHQQLLKDYPGIGHLYDTLSSSIRHFQKEAANPHFGLKTLG